MNRYASGYTLISLISVIGWLAIALSLIGGIIIGANAPRGLGYIGFTIAITGSFQGLLLLGVGAIGAAILDGAIVARRSFELQENFFSTFKSCRSEPKSGFDGARDSNSVEKTSPSAEEEESRKKLREELRDDDKTLELKTSYFGYNIRIHSHGFSVGQRVFGSILEAYRAIDSVKE